MDQPSYFDDLPLPRTMVAYQTFCITVGADEVVFDSPSELQGLLTRRERIDSEDITLAHPLFRHVKTEALVNLDATGGIMDSMVRKRKNSTQSTEEPTLLQEFRVN